VTFIYCLGYSLFKAYQYSKYATIGQLFYIVGTTVVKFSVAVLLARIAPTPFYRYLLWFLAVSMSMYNFLMFFICVFQCQPYSYTWTRMLGGPGSCMSEQVIINMAYTFSALDIFFNFAFGLLPIPMLWNVQMTRGAKACLYFVLGLGCLWVSPCVVDNSSDCDLANENQCVCRDSCQDEICGCNCGNH
jgi:hypothetical protein